MVYKSLKFTLFQLSTLLYFKTTYYIYTLKLNAYMSWEPKHVHLPNMLK